MDKVKPYVIGVDLGGTNTVFGVVNARGEVVGENSIKTQQYKTAEEFVEAGVECLKPLLAQIGGTEQVQGMGIGAPNGNYYNGTIEFAPNLPWAHDGVVPLAEMFSKKTGIPVKLTNDANAAFLCSCVLEPVPVAGPTLLQIDVIVVKAAPPFSGLIKLA